MPIVHMTRNYEGYGDERKLRTDFPEGAWCPLEYKDIVLYTTHHGLCLFESERNGYHDSDFYMTVWNEEAGKPESILFATTRGWTYPCYASHPDATDEVRAKYEAWKRERERKERIQHRWNERRQVIKEAEAMKVSRPDVKRLRAATGDRYPGLFRLMKTKKFRSAFRASLAKQVRDWLADTTTQYARPLSWKQMDYL